MLNMFIMRKTQLQRAPGYNIWSPLQTSLQGLILVFFSLFFQTCKIFSFTIFLVQRIDFWAAILEVAKTRFWSKKIFRAIDLFDLVRFFGQDFFEFSAHCEWLHVSHPKIYIREKQVMTSKCVHL